VIQIITIDSELYPGSLKEIKNPPQKLFCMGNVSLLSSKCLAVVGSRRISRYGEEIVKDLVPRLAVGGFTIVSGMAVGVDKLAHWEALNVGCRTIGILGCGLKNMKHTADLNLIKEVINSSRGLIVSPFTYSTKMSKLSFIMRNEVIAAVSIGVLVIEAAEKSGALVTAEFAMDQNKPVFAVPGSIFNKNSKGCHFLIRNGGVLVESHETVMNAL